MCGKHLLLSSLYRSWKLLQILLSYRVVWAEYSQTHHFPSPQPDICDSSALAYCSPTASYYLPSLLFKKETQDYPISETLWNRELKPNRVVMLCALQFIEIA